MASKPKAPTFTSPKGVFVFPKLNQPDTKFKAEGEFAVKLRLRADDDATKAFIAKLQPLHDKAVENANVAFGGLAVAARKKLKEVTVNALYTEVFDETTEQPTGDVEFKFALPAKGVIKTGKSAGSTYVKRPGIFDASGKCVVPGISFKVVANEAEAKSLLKKAGPDIWGGTVGKVSVEVGMGADGEPGYFIPGTGAAGLSLRIQAVQVIDLVSGGTRKAGDYGFGAEDGYSHEDEADGAPTTTEAGDPGPSDDAGDGDF